MREQDADLLRTEIENLIRNFPEVAEDEILRADMLDGETAISDVLTSLIRLGEDARSMRDATKAQLDNLKARGDRFGRRIDFTRALIFRILEASNLKKMELAEGTVYLRNNAPALIGDLDGDKLPDEYVKVERKPDKKKVKDAMIAGATFEGLALSNQPPSVVVVIR